MNFKFQKDIENGLIIIEAIIDSKYEMNLVLDTGCTNTTIDFNALYMVGYDLKDTIGSVQIETANGIVDTSIYKIKSMSSLGIIKNDFSIQVYDFLTHGIFSSYDGLLGLDFLDVKNFCIDFKTQLISIE